MRQMVYCRYMSHSDTSVKYAFGQTIDDITGILEYDFSKGTIQIIQQPKAYKILIRQIESLLGRYRNEFANGIYRIRIAYEA